MRPRVGFMLRPRLRAMLVGGGVALGVARGAGGGVEGRSEGGRLEGPPRGAHGTDYAAAYHFEPMKLVLGWLLSA